MTPRGLELTLPARAENVAVVRHALAGMAEALEMDPAQVADLKTVVTEACMNVVVHAYEDDAGPMEIDAYPDGEALIVTVRDRGAGIRPRPDTTRQSLRMGLPLIAALSTSFELSGAPDRGTEVTMRMNISRNGDLDAAVAHEPAADGAAMAMPAGQLVSPVLSRIISIFAVRANFSVDRLSDAVLLGDAISAQTPAHFPDGTAHVHVDEDDGALVVSVGPMVDGGGEEFLSRLRIPEIDATLEGLADDIRVESDGDSERLVLELKPKS